MIKQVYQKIEKNKLFYLHIYKLYNMEDKKSIITFMTNLQVEMKKDLLENFLTSINGQVRNTLQLMNASLCQTANGKKIYGELFTTMWKIGEEVENKLTIEKILGKYYSRVGSQFSKLFGIIENNRLIIEALKSELESRRVQMDEFKKTVAECEKNKQSEIDKFNSEKLELIEQHNAKQMELIEQHNKEKMAQGEHLKEMETQADMYRAKYAEKLIERRLVVDKVRLAVENYQKSPHQ